MIRNLALSTAFFALAGCLSVVDAREGGAQRTCRFQDRCGNIGSGQHYATFADCLTEQRSDFLNTWPTDRCDGRINGETLNVCYQAIDNTQCNNLVDYFATLSKCQSSDVCTAGSASGACKCTSGQTCCGTTCTNLATDRNNCGGCGTTCGAGLGCQSGVCR
jgi:hypothetical protein